MRSYDQFSSRSFIRVPAGAVVEALAIDPVTTTVLYAGTLGQGVFKSTNGGATWQRKNVGLTNLRILSLAVHPLSPLRVFAGTEQGLFASTDGGGSWSRVSLNTGGAGIPALAVVNVPDLVLYVGTEAAGLFKVTETLQPSSSGGSGGGGGCFILSIQ